MADFLEDYARRFELPVRSGVRVDRLQRQDGRFVLTCGGQRMEAATVVVATGAYQTPWIPEIATQLSADVGQWHSRDYRKPAQLRPGSVLVVGAGNSGAEIALETARHGHRTFLSGRPVGQESPFRPGSLPDRVVTPLGWFVFSRVLTTRTPVGRKLRQTFRTRGTPLVRVRPKDMTAVDVERVARTAEIRDGVPVLADGRKMEVSNVIWCTGFRPDFGWIDLPILDDAGHVVHQRGVVSSAPGLYVVGQFFLHSLTSSLVGGVGRDAAYIARHKARSPAATPRVPPAVTPTTVTWRPVSTTRRREEVADARRSRSCCATWPDVSVAGRPRE
jgi:putative flavoprotein involved in K+ transport